MRSLISAGNTSARRLSRLLAPCVAAVEQLEPRIVFNATVTTAVPAQTIIINSAPTSINLNTYFNDPNITGTAVLMQTNEGNIPLTLDDSEVSTTVQNFLSYVNSGEYNDTFIHRVVTVASGNIGIVQGGGYNVDGTAIATAAPIPLQYNVANAPDTIAMARTSSPNTATSEWFFNVTDNSSALGPANGGGYSVFGTALYGGPAVINTIYNLTLGSYPTSDGSPNTNQVPTTDGNSGTATPSDLVVVQNAAVVNPLTYTVTSDNPGVVVPTVSGKNLTLSYVSGQLGTANITVTATDLGGNSVSSTFAVTVEPVPAPTVVTLGSGAGHEVKFKDPNGTAATAYLTGPGSGTVSFAGVVSSSTSKSGVVTISGIPTSVSIDATGTTSASTLNIQSPSGRPIFISEISTNSDIRAVSASRVALSGSMTIAGSVTNIALDTVSGGAITVSGSSGALALVLNTNSAEDVTSSEAIASIQATSWTGTPTIDAPSVGRVNIVGQIDANISAGSLGPVTAGIIGTSTWTITGAVSNITAGGINALNLVGASIGRVTSRQVINNSSVTTPGNIAAIAAVALSGSTINAGLPTSGSNGVPTGFGASSTISSVVLGHGGFSNSVIAASSLGNVTLGPTASSNGGTPFGVGATQIKSLSVVVDRKLLSVTKVTTQAQVSAAVTKAGITLNDLFIAIV